MPEKSLFQQAQEAVGQLTNKQKSSDNGTSIKEKQAAQNAIQAAYEDCTPDEKNQLQELEAHLKQENHLQ